MKRVLWFHLVFILLSACRPAADSVAAAVDTPAPNLGKAGCSALVYSGFSQASGYSKTLRESQLRAKNDPEIAQLEQLGWAYVSYAREKQSPEHYYLAGQVADCMVATHGSRAEAKLLRSHVLHQQHQFLDAETLAAELVAERGFWFDYAVLGDALLEQGKLDEAADAYQRMVDQKPGGEAYGRIGHLRWLTGDLHGAMEMMTLAVGSTSPRDRAAGAFWQTRLAHLLWADHQDEMAFAILDKVMHDVEDYRPAIQLKARILLGLGRYQEAMSELDSVLVQKEQPEYLWLLWEALSAAGDPVKSNEISQRLLALGARTDRITTSLFLSAQKVEVDRAISLAAQELTERQDARTMGAMAAALLANGEVGKANKIVGRALATGSIEPRLYLQAAGIAARQGDMASTKHWTNKARERQQMLLPSEQKMLNRLSIDS